MIFCLLLLLAIVSIGVRFLPHFPNFTPIGAFALFAGAYFSRKYKWGLGLPLLLMLVSDFFIGFYDWKLMAVVYASFAIYGIIGMLVAKRQNAGTVVLGSFAGAVFFYLATNFAVWAFSPWYEKTFEGLILSYALALPFFRFTLLGDLVFSGIFFGVYEFARQLVLRPSSFQQSVFMIKKK